ncbi:photosynthetic NDH subunit of subcomplex B 3, chloroplastic [Panicum miliaceum]|uniref:Photosynthetic NDH subunit of subcomplex B 3, chloroplastic n=1 Tax=Panicum miliaceum TaxID=4540 RepID=A0A3L6T8J9_PANMI|nr:photosynthetic NDH subunit of subcomplex B 3, chloroplastic [Panicum miliaceum]
MGSTVQLTGLLGVSSPPLVQSHRYSCSGAGKQSCSLRAPRRQGRRLRAVEMGAPGGEPPAAAPEEPSVDFAFVSLTPSPMLQPRLLPDGTPDVHYRTARGGQKLRDIMLEGYIDLYGPYDKLLLNCSGGGVCGTCIVEVVQGKEMLSPKTEVEKELLKRKPKTWRLACQATVGNADSTGQMVIQQLPEWKIHEWDKQK